MEMIKAHIKDIIHLSNLMNIKIHALIKKFLVIKWKDWNLRIVKYLPKVIKYLYVNLMIKDTFSSM